MTNDGDSTEDRKRGHIYYEHDFFETIIGVQVTTGCCCFSDI